MPIATRNPAMTRRSDDTRTIPSPPRESAASAREGMIGALAVGLVAAVAAGDPEAARIANEAIGRLLGPAPAETEAGAVVEFARARRSGR